MFKLDILNLLCGKIVHCNGKIDVWKNTKCIHITVNPKLHKDYNSRVSISAIKSKKS